MQAGIADARETLGANGQEHAKTGPARSDSPRSAEKTEHACFDEQLAHNAAARRADGETESDLLAAVGGASEKQTGNVDAANQQKGRSARKERSERGPKVADGIGLHSG